MASETVSPAIATPAAAAVRSSPSSIARAMPLRRCVGATVTPLIAHIGIRRPPGSDMSVTQELTVPTGWVASSDAGS